MPKKINLQFYSVSVAKKQGCECIYSCCNEDVDSSGCKEACKKCEGKWGTKANNSFKKNHNVTEIQDMMKDLIPDLKKISELGNKWNPAFMGSKKSEADFSKARC